MVNWQIDEAAAAELDGMGLDWEQKDIRKEQVNVRESRHNGARRYRIDESAVADYRESMQRGDVFPMIVVCKVDGSYGLVIAGGNHRHAAVEGLSDEAIPAMCCSASAVQFAILSRRLNRTNGKRETRADRVKQAAELVAVFGLDQNAAADAMDVPQSTLATEIRAMEVRQALVLATGDDCSEVSNNVIVTMSKFRNDHNVLQQLATLAKSGAGRDEMRGTLRELSKLPTEAAKVEMLAGLCDQRKKKTVGGRGVAMKIAQNFRRITTQLENIILKGESCNMQMDGPELAKIAKRLETLTTAVKAMSGGRS
jgi:hypothetical protein